VHGSLYKEQSGWTQLKLSTSEPAREVSVRYESYFLDTVRLLLVKGASPLNKMHGSMAQFAPAKVICDTIMCSLVGTDKQLREKMTAILLSCDNVFALAAAFGWTDALRLFLSSINPQTLSCVSFSAAALNSYVRYSHIIEANYGNSDGTIAPSVNNDDDNGQFTFAGKLFRSNPLLFAVCFSNNGRSCRCLEYLLERTVFATLINHMDQAEDLNPLIAACSLNNGEVIELLKRFGVDNHIVIEHVGTVAVNHVTNTNMTVELKQRHGSLQRQMSGESSQELRFRFEIYNEYRNYCRFVCGTFHQGRVDSVQETSISDGPQQPMTSANRIMTSHHSRVFADCVYRTKEGSQARILADLLFQVCCSIKKLLATLDPTSHGNGNHHGQLNSSSNHNSSSFGMHNLTAESAHEMLCQQGTVLIQYLKKGPELFAQAKCLLLATTELNLPASASERVITILSKELTSLEYVIAKLEENAARSMRKWSQESEMKPAVLFIDYIIQFAQSIQLMIAEYNANTLIQVHSVIDTTSASSSRDVERYGKMIVELVEYVRDCSQLTESVELQLVKQVRTMPVNSLFSTNNKTDNLVESASGLTIALETMKYLVGSDLFDRKYTSISSNNKLLADALAFSIPCALQHCGRYIWWDMVTAINRPDHWNALEALIPVIVRFEDDITAFIKRLCSQEGGPLLACRLLW
jgi:hypothetical protein